MWHALRVSLVPQALRTLAWLTWMNLFLAGCRDNSACPNNEACIQKECRDPCPFQACGLNAFCLTRNHIPICICEAQHEGNPYDNCQRYECKVHEECPTTLACRNFKCEDPCNCKTGEECVVTNHQAKCSCPPGYQNDIFTGVCSPGEPNLVSISYGMSICLQCLFHLFSAWACCWWFWMQNRCRLSNQVGMFWGKMQKPMCANCALWNKCRL